MTAENATDPAALWARAITTWTEAWTSFATATGTATPGAASAPTDPLQLWRKAADQWLEAWTALLERSLQTPEAAATGGRVLDTMLNVEKPVRERTAAAMQYWLELFNLPSRTDVIRALTGLNDANARLDELQVQIESLADQVTELAAVRADATAAPVTAKTR